MSKINGAWAGVKLPAQDIYEESSTQKHRLGELLVIGDRKFRYCKNGAGALAIGKMVCPPAKAANHVENVQTAYGLTAGQITITILTAANDVTADQYKDGYVVCNKGTGLGSIYKIKTNTASTSAYLVTVTLYDAVILDVPAASELSLVPSKYTGLVVCPTTAISPAVGVPVIAVTALYYFWCQTAGIAPAIADTGDTLVAGEPVGYPATIAVAGAFGVPAVTDEIWGNCWYSAIAAEASLVDLKMD